MYLPKEIIKEVGKYLTIEEQASCIRVCYAWYGPFLDLLYTKVQLKSRNQFRLFYDTIRASSQIDDPLGDHVKELRFAYDTGIIRGSKTVHPVGLTRDEVETFAELFKNLEVLDFNPKLWKYMRYSAGFTRLKKLKRFPTFNRQAIFQPIVDNMASQLTYLSISGEATEFILNNNLTTSIWNRIPKLEELIIRGSDHVNINVKMIMALGAQLLHLKHLTLACITLPLDEHDMTSTTTFPLFTSVLSLRLDDVHLKNWRMITFLSLAFYRVEVLDFDVTFNWFYNDNVTIELYEQSMDACMGFAQLCIFLKKIKFRRISTSVFPFPYDAFFQEIADIHQNNVQVEMTDYAWWSTIDPTASFKAVTTQTGLLSRANLKYSWTGKKTDMALFKNLKTCANLTSLKLECDVVLKNGIRIDLLLENCKKLEDLYLSETLVTTFINMNQQLEEECKKINSLKSLELYNAAIGDSLMEYLSKFCLNLQELCLTNCVQEKPKRTSFIVIRMPEHNFKTIKLNSLHLNPGSNNNSNNNNHQHQHQHPHQQQHQHTQAKCDTNISILSFYDMKRYQNQNSRIQKANSTIKPEMWRFYHVHKATLAKKDRQIRRLSTKEAAVIANFEMTDKKWKSIRNSVVRKQYQDVKLWEKDIQFGTVLLLVNSVDLLIFNDLKV